MKSRRSPAGFAGFAVLAASLVASVAGAAEPRYRIFQIVSNDPTQIISAGAPNNRGQVVGQASDRFGVPRHAFLWQNGIFTDLHDLIAPDATNSGAFDINNHRTIIGDIDFSRGFKLRRTQVTNVTVVPGETTVTPRYINDRGQMVVDSFGGPVQGVFLVDGDSAELLPELPGASEGVIATGLSELGVVAGVALFSDFTRRGVIWQNGVITDLGVPAGFDSTSALGINSRNRVAGAALLNFEPKAASWQDGVWTLLPSIAPGEPQVSEATGINKRGAMVGGTTITGDNFARRATLWLNGRALAIDDLIVADDPLKPFVNLTTARGINDRGDIVSLGDDSRGTGNNIYFLRRVHDQQ